jgi:transposase-like protein
VKINGKLCYLWRAVDHEGEALETVVTVEQDKAAALKFLKRIMTTRASHAEVPKPRRSRNPAQFTLRSTLF